MQLGTRWGANLKTRKFRPTASTPPLARAVAEPAEKKSPRIVPRAGLLAARARRGSGTPPRIAGGLGVGPHGPLEAGSTQHAEAAS